MKIFLDFDDTIFNTKKYKIDYKKVFISHKIKKKDFLDPFFDYPIKKNGRLISYNLNKYKKIIRKKLDENIFSRFEKDVEYFLDNSKKYVHKDFFSFIKNFKKNQLFLISFGDIKSQTRKIRTSGVTKYFKKIKITIQGKSVYIKKIATKKEGEIPNEIIFIDDRPDQIKEVKKALPNCLCLRIKRKTSRFNDLKTSGKAIIEIKNLKEAQKIIRKYHPDL